MTARNAGAPFGQRSAAQARNVQPRTCGINFSRRSHPKIQNATANSASTSEPAKANVGVFAGTLATSTVSALPACCTGARNVTPSGVAVFAGSNMPAEMNQRNGGKDNRRQPDHRAKQMARAEQVGAFAGRPAPDGDGEHRKKGRQAQPFQRRNAFRRRAPVSRISAKPETSASTLAGASVPLR